MYRKALVGLAEERRVQPGQQGFQLFPGGDFPLQGVDPGGAHPPFQVDDVGLEQLGGAARGPQQQAFAAGLQRTRRAGQSGQPGTGPGHRHRQPGVHLFLEDKGHMRHIVHILAAGHIGGQKDDLTVRLQGQQPLGQRDAAFLVGQADVQDGQLESLPGGCLQQRVAAGKGHDAVGQPRKLPFQLLLHLFQQELLVVAHRNGQLTFGFHTAASHPPGAGDAGPLCSHLHHYSTKKSGRQSRPDSVSRNSTRCTRGNSRALPPQRRVGGQPGRRPGS